MMKQLNIFRSKHKVPETVTACNVKFGNIQIDRKMDRRGFLQAIAGGLTRRGWDASVAQEGSPFDIAVFCNVEQASQIFSKYYSNLEPTAVKAESVPVSVIERAWQNRVRLELLKKG